MLGAQVSMVLRVGNDPHGTEAIDFLRQQGVDADWVQIDPAWPTGIVNVLLHNGQPTYEIVRDVAWDRLAWIAGLEEILAAADAVCFGSLGQRCAAAAETIQRCVRRTPPGSLRLFDINLRPPHFSEEILLQSLQLANALKLNEEELPILADIIDLTGSPTEQLRSLQSQFELRWVAWTRGSDGSLLMSGEEISEILGEPVQVVDTVGAGDSFTAAFITEWLKGRPLAEAHRRASQVVRLCMYPEGCRTTVATTSD